MKFEEKLVKLRKQNAWSQEELAEKLDVTRQTISKWELGQTTPDMDKLTKIAEVFEITVNDLCDENIDTKNIDDEKENKDTTDTKKVNKNAKNKAKTRLNILVGILVLTLCGILGISLYKIYDRINNPDSKPGLFQNLNWFGSTFEDKFDFNKNSFNSKFKTLYYGKVQGKTMSYCIDEIIKSNEENSDKIIAIKYKDIETFDVQEMKKIKDYMNGNKEYEVSYEYDNEGYINKTIIGEGKLTEFAKKSFNNRLKTQYFGSEEGTFMENFIDKIIKSNEENPENMITVNYNGIETSETAKLRELKNEFSSRYTYYISYEYDDDGVINKALVEKEKIKESAVDSFNNMFKSLYFGSKDGFFMSGFIDAVIKSNEKNPENIITVSFNGKETSNADELRRMKNQFVNGRNYEVSYEYDEEGLIKKAIVKK